MVKHTVILAIITVSLFSVFRVKYYYPAGNNQNLSINKKVPEKNLTVMPAVFGNPFMSHYQFGNTDIQIYSICQDNNGEMILAYKQGIIIFNGKNWDKLKLPSVPSVLKFLKGENIVLIGFENQYGYLQRNRLGVYEYHNLSEIAGLSGEITDIKITNSYIYFYGEKSLIKYNRKNLDFDKSLYSATDIIQNGIVQIGENIYINIPNKGICKIEPNGEKSILFKSRLISQKQIAFSVPVSSSKVIVGTLGGGLYTFDGNIISEFSNPAQKYISESLLTSGVDLTNDIFAVSTIAGGCVILSKKDGKIVNIIDIKTGLPDNEIYAITKDSNEGLWLSHGYGLSRVDYNLPVQDFNNYQGIEGNIIDVVVFNKRTYIATNQGVFYQDSIIKLKEVEKPKENDKKTEKKSVFRKWKDRIKGTEKTDKTEKTTKNDKTEKKDEKAKIYSVNYIFKKIKDINGKCKQLIKYRDVILVASNNGLYEIKNINSKIILKKDYINCIVPSKLAGFFYIGTDKGITAIKKDNEKWLEYPKVQPKGLNEPVYTITEDGKQNVWIGTDNKVYRTALGKNMLANSSQVYDFGDEIPERFSIQQINNNIFFLSNYQIYRFNTKSNRIEADNVLNMDNLPYIKHIASQNQVTWLQNEEKWACISDNYKPNQQQISLLNLFENIQNIYVDENKNLWIVDGEKGLFKIPANNELSNKEENFKVIVQKIKNNQGNLVSPANIEIDADINSLTFTISAPNYLKPQATTYQYFISGVMKEWSEWNTTPNFVFYVQPGTYKLQARAKNILGNISNSEEYTIFVKSPFWMKTWFLILSFLLILLIFAFSIILVQKKKQQKLLKDNKILETKVEERTVEIVKQKELIERKNREIIKSLKYASHIQTAVLPSKELFKEYVGDYFIFNKPRDIVSGDFYWTKKLDGKLLVTAADCTGHGVPGAFLSLLGVTFLNEITSKMESLSASLILEQLRERLINSLNKDNDGIERLDGMDITMVIIDYPNMKLQFAGAYNSMYLVRNSLFLEYKGDKMPVGMHAYKDKPFTNQEVDILKGDVIYMFSDGFIDQFGGETGRKFFGKNFRALLTEISNHPMNEQSELLGEILETWRGDYNQVDDILIVGIKI